MPRSGGIYTPPAGSKGSPGTTIQSGKFNALVDDLAADANIARPVTAGGTGASNATAARIALGLEIGTNVQAFDAALQSIAGLTTAADRMIYTTAADVYAVTALTAFARSLLDDVDAATMRATLGLVLGTNVQAYDAGLQSIAGLTTAADRMIYTTGSDAYATTALTPFARSILDDTDAPSARNTIGADNAANLASGILPSGRLAGNYGFNSLTLDDTLYVKNIVEVTVPAGNTPAVSLTRNGVRVALLYFDSSDTLVLRRFNPVTGAGEGFIRLTGNGVNDIIYNNFKIWHEGNDGSGTGLDADTLDGQQGSYYRDLANSTGTLPSSRVSGNYAMAMLSLSARLTITDSSPEIKFIDTTSGEYSARMRVNANNVYFDSSTDDVNFGEVFRFELDNKRGYVAGSQIVTSDGVTPAFIASKLGYTPAGLYTGTNASETSFPIGHTVLVSTVDRPNNNTSNTIRLLGTNQYTNDATGTALSGTWRCRGSLTLNSDRLAIFERTA